MTVVATNQPRATPGSSLSHAVSPEMLAAGPGAQAVCPEMLAAGPAMAFTQAI